MAVGDPAQRAPMTYVPVSETSSLLTDALRGSYYRQQSQSNRCVAFLQQHFHLEKRWQLRCNSSSYSPKQALGVRAMPGDRLGVTP